MTPASTRELIEQLIRESPGISVAEIADQVNVSRQRTDVLLREMGYERVTIWRKKKVRPGK